MPLRDHFRLPTRHEHRWEGFHSAWANTIVRHLNGRWLPERYRAEPEIHLGTAVEVDVANFERLTWPEESAGNGVATAVWAPPQPTRTLAVSFAAQDLFEVRVVDEHRAQRLVAAVELVSPRNKDRPESRRAFAVKCASYLQQQVSVVVVDVVTERHDNLFAEVLRVLAVPETTPQPDAALLYAVACRTTKKGEQWHMDTWAEPLAVGTALPTVPLWLADNLAVPLHLEESYEETCQVLRLR